MTNGISARRDIAVIAVVAVIAAIACVKLNLSEALLAWTRPYEGIQLDELPAVLFVVSVSLIWFSARRVREAREQLRLRVSAETCLAEALAENQRLAQQYVDMQESERKALARDLHDELGQYLNAIKLDAVSVRAASTGQHVLQEPLRDMIANIDRVYAVVTGLIRQLRPVGLDDLGFAAALEHCVNEWRSRLGSTTIDLSVVGVVDDLGETRALVLYRLVQEALTNIARHSRATRVSIRIERRAAGSPVPSIGVLVADNGVGADLTAQSRGLGLLGMRERVSALGGRVTVTSKPGAGFEVGASLPMVVAP